MTDNTAHARMLAAIAADLDRRGYPSTGLLRDAARALLDHRDLDPNGCRRCGTPLTQPATGRRRVWCSERCRRQHRP